MIKTVVSRIYGGLGNQMFQYAAAYGLARDHGAKLLLDLSSFDETDFRAFQLDRWSAPVERWSGRYPDKIRRKKRVADHIKGHLRRWIRSDLDLDVYAEPSLEFDPDFFEQSYHTVLLSGYFQSHRYFNRYGDEIRALFQPCEALGSRAAHWREKISATTFSVSLHIRRGDYVSNPEAARMHGHLTEPYYERAIDLMRRLYGPGLTVFVFSDDLNYAAELFDGIANLNLVDSEEDRPWDDMTLMSCCDHNIIANSSFSWWGAWLNANPGKTVIAPAQWFSDEVMRKTNTLHRIPEDWIMLQ